MPKSRVRGGQKAHNKRIKNRNMRLGIQKSAVQKKFNELFEAQMKELKEKYSAEIVSENKDIESSEVVENVVNLKPNEELDGE